MKSAKIIRLFSFMACLVLVTGCAATVGTTSLPIGMEQGKLIPNSSNSVELAILSEVPVMSAGEDGVVNNIRFTVGETYTAASGRRCKPVTITGLLTANSTSGRVVCESDPNWFFSKDVFLTSSVSD